MAAAVYANAHGTDVLLTDTQGTTWATKPNDPRLAGMEIAPFVPPPPPPAPTEAEIMAQVAALLAQLPPKPQG